MKRRSSLRVLGLALALVVGMTMIFGLVPSLRPGSPALGQRPQGRRTRQLAGPAAAASEPGRRRGRAGVRAAREPPRCSCGRSAQMTRVPLGVAPQNVVLAGVQLTAGFDGWLVADRRRPARERPRSHPPAARRALGRQRQHPADGVTAGGTRSSQPISRRPARKTGRRRSTIRSARATSRRWARARRGPGVHRARHARRRGRGHRQRDAGAAVLPRTARRSAARLCRRRRRSVRWAAT